MYKKIACLFMLIVLATCLLVGCGAATEDDQLSGSPDADKTANADHSTNGSPFNKSVLYREDFEIPDCRGLGYTNLIDFYNDYPNGKAGGTYENAGLMIHYPGDLDKDVSDQESLDFKTYRGIGLGSGIREVFDAYGAATLCPPNEWQIGISDTEHTLKQYADYMGRVDSGAYVFIRFYFDQNDTVMFIDYAAVYAQYASSVNSSNVFEFVTKQ